MTRRSIAALILAIGTVCTAPSVLAQSEGPDPNALSAVVIDAGSGRVLFAKNSRLRLPPASTTKIMTGLLLLEHCASDEVVTAPRHVRDTKESSMHLQPGESLTARDLLYAVMLRSANDGCHAAAVHIAGSDAAFADLMNKRAQEIGCTDTTFANPHGLPHPRHLTTALDLALMAREAMRNPEFADVAATQKRVIARSLNQKDTLMVNHDRWLEMDPRARGVKTGWTRAAGHCFVGCATAGDMTVITAVMKSPDWVFDTQMLVDFAFDHFAYRQLVRKGEVVGEVKVTGGTEPTVPVRADRDLAALVSALAPATGLVVDPGLTVSAPVKEGDLVGTGVYWIDEATTVEVPLVAGQAVPRSAVGRLTTPIGLGGFLVLAGGAIAMRARARRWAREFSA